MKGQGGIPSILEFFSLLAVLTVSTLLIQLIMIIFGVTSQFTAQSPRNVEITALFQPIKYDSLVVSFLNAEYDGIEVRRILNHVAIQKSTRVWIDGKIIDAEAVLTGMISSVADKPFLLKIRDPEIIIARNGDLTSNLVKVSTKLYLLDGSSVDLEFYSVAL